MKGRNYKEERPKLQGLDKVETREEGDLRKG